MNRNVLLFLLLGILASPASADAPATSPAEVRGDPAQRLACVTASGAQSRKRQVERGLLPNVVFTGEGKPATIEARMAAHRVPALSVAVIDDGKLAWTAAWGQLQAGGVRADCDTLFQAGSIAKPVTVLAAFRMKEQGRLDFDRNIEEYLTTYEVPAGKQTAANPVTLRNLFAHTAGITPGGYMGYPHGHALPTDLQTVRAEPPANSRKVEVLEAPNASLNYSGGGYTVAEIALQDQLDEPFEQIMREWIIAPAGMRQADFTQPLPDASHAHAARGHRSDGSAVGGGWHDHPEQAAAGLWATPSDLAAFLIEVRKAHRGKSKVFAQASIRELLAKPVDRHAYGFRLIGEGEQVFITHYGGTAGYNAGMTLNLETGEGAVYMANSDNGPQLGPEFLAAVSRTYGWPVFREVQVTRAKRSADVLQSLTGRYDFPESGAKVSVLHEKGGLTMVFPNSDRYAMTPIEGASLEFIHADSAVRATFERRDSEVLMQLYGETGLREPPSG